MRWSNGRADEDGWRCATQRELSTAPDRVGRGSGWGVGAFQALAPCRNGEWRRSSADESW